jgi:hypothetical protein
MKKSDLKLLRERNQKAVQPSAPKKEDASDELSALFDDGTKLSSTGVTAVTQGSGGQTPSGGQTTPPPSLPRQTPKPTHAPARDFNRRANSLERDALPAGLFPGSSKKIYDALYVRSRGAFVPSKTVRATKRDLAEWSGVRNRKTLDSHLRYLAACGLVIREWHLGQNEGYLFEVRLPEEAGLVDRGGQGDRPPEGTDQKRDGGTDQKLGSGGQTQTVDSIDTSAEPKTSFKTKDQSDDDQLPHWMRDAVSALARDLTGREATPDDFAQAPRLFAAACDLVRRAALNSSSVSAAVAYGTSCLKARATAEARRHEQVGRRAKRPPGDLGERPAPAEESRPVTAAELASNLSELLSTGYPREGLREQFGRDMTDEEWGEIKAKLSDLGHPV